MNELSSNRSLRREIAHFLDEKAGSMPKITEMPFDVERIDGEDGPILVLHGELDMVSSTRLHETFHEIIQERDGANVLINLTDVTFIDSGGLGTLVSADRQLRKTGGSLRIIGISERAARVFETTGLNHRFGLADNTNLSQPSSFRR